MENKELMNVRQESVDRFLVQRELRKRLSAVDAGAGACEPSAEDAAARFGVQFLYRDFRPLFKAGQARARELGFYMQKYCGCVFSEEERYRKASKIIP